MTHCKTSLTVELPEPEAADLAVRAAAKGVSTPELLGNYVLRGAYGALHPLVVAFDSRPKQGQIGEE